MKRVSFYSAVFLCLFPTAPLVADDAPKLPANTGKFGGIGMGLGVSLTHDLGWNDRITKAQVVNGIVRVDEQRNDIARLVFEAHYFFTPNISLTSDLVHGAWGHGPFVAVAPTTGSDKLIDGLGLGWMIGFRNRSCKWESKNSSAPQQVCTWSDTSWNFGIGFMLDANSKILGDGIRANQPLPPGEDLTKPVRLKDTSQGGLMFITSFAF